MSFIRLGKYIINVDKISFIELKTKEGSSGNGSYVNFCASEGSGEGFATEYVELSEEDTCKLLLRLNIK